MNSGDLLQDGQRERNHGKAIEIDLSLRKETSMNNQNTDINGRQGVNKKILLRNDILTLNYP